MSVAQINLPREVVAAFCRRSRIRELALFGSALRGDFGPESDVDVLVSFEVGAGWSLMDAVPMEDDLAAILGRPVDLGSRWAIEHSDHWIRRDAILASAEVVYATG